MEGRSLAGVYGDGRRGGGKGKGVEVKGMRRWNEEGE